MFYLLWPPNIQDVDSCHLVTDPEMKLKVIKDKEVGVESLVAIAYEVGHSSIAPLSKNKNECDLSCWSICFTQGSRLD